MFVHDNVHAARDHDGRAREQRAVGAADQNIQSIANAQTIEVYSNGPTTEGGARRNASVSQYCPKAPLMPSMQPRPVFDRYRMPVGQRQNRARRARQASTQKTIAVFELVRPSRRTVSALNA